MVHARSFALGIAATIALAALGTVVSVVTGALPSGADVKPSKLETTAAHVSLRASIGRETAGLRDPVAPTDAALAAGARLYGADCAVCHGAADGKPSLLARGFYIKAPQLAKDGVEDDPEPVTFWKLTHGIRFTAMPAFGKTLGSDDLWRITAFVKRMDHLPPGANAVWRAMPSVAPAGR